MRQHGTWLRRSGLGAVVLAVVSIAIAIAAPPGAVADGFRNNEIVHRVPRATSDIVVDGVLDEPAWRNALVLSLDDEVSPGDNVPPPVRTELEVTFDDRQI